MGMLIGDFVAFLAMYFVGIIFSSLLMYFLIILPVYFGNFTSEFLDYYSRAFQEYALNYVAKSWIIAPLVLFFVCGSYRSLPKGVND